MCLLRFKNKFSKPKMMNNLHKIIFACFFVFSNIVAQSNEDTIFHKANESYIQQDYPTAINLYSDIISAGYISANLYYNLGNAYFKNEELSNAILWYERALRLDPTNEDIIHNIAFANKKITDEMEIMPEFFLKKWFKSVYSFLSATGWAITSIVICFVLFLTIAFILLSAVSKRRVYLFFVAMFLALFLAISILFAVIQSNQSLRNDEAIIMHKSVIVKSMPDQSGTDLFTVHDGLKVLVVDKVGNWIEVVFPNGHKGWIKEISVEII